MKALITGCAGFIGSHLAVSLLADGHEVVGVDCFTDNYRRSLKHANLAHAAQWDGFRFIHADLAEQDPAPVVDGCDAVFHLAAEPGVRPSWGQRFATYVRNNVLVTQRLLEAARDEPARPFVYASSSSVYGQALTLPTSEDAPTRPFSPYGLTKLSGEQLCGIYHANHGVRTVALRFFTVYGPRQRPDMAFHRFCRAALLGEPMTLLGDGGQTRDFTYVDDVVAAVRAGAAAPAAAGLVYNVGGGSRVSLMKAVETLATIVERPLVVQVDPEEPGDVRDTGADITRAMRDLGWRPRTSLQEGLRREFAWLAALPDLGAPAALHAGPERRRSRRFARAGVRRVVTA